MLFRSFDQLEQADMDIMVAATYENIMMVEGEMSEVSEAELLEAMKVAHEAIKVHCKAQMELTEMVGKTVKREYCHEENDEELRKAVHDACYDKSYAIAASGNRNKHEGPWGDGERSGRYYQVYALSCYKLEDFV